MFAVTETDRRVSPLLDEILKVKYIHRIKPPVYSVVSEVQIDSSDSPLTDYPLYPHHSW